MWRFPKKRNWIRQPCINCSHIWHIDMYINQTHNLWMFCENTLIQKSKVVNYMKILKKRNKMKGCSITCSHIWQIDTSKYVYWLDIYSVKIWWNYVLPYTNVVNFCDIFSDTGQCFHRATKTVLEIKNPTMSE